MTLSTTENRKSYSGDGSTTQFAFPYKYLATSDLVVVLINASDVETILTETTHYSVSTPDPSGGTVTMVTAPASGETLVIYREEPLTQGFDPEEGGPLPADELENAFDKLTMIVQQFYDAISRMLRLKIGSTYSDLELPDPEALKYLQWKSDLSGLQNVVEIDSSLISVSSFMEALLAETNINSLFGALDQPFWIVDPDLADQNAAGSVGSIAWILAQLSSSEGYLICPAGGTLTITDDLTIPATVTLKVMNGAQFSIASAKTLTINGTIEAGEYQIFAGTGDIDFIDGIQVKSSWFADFETAVDKIDSDKVELLVDAASTIAADLTVPSNIKLRWITDGNLLTVASTKTLTIQGPIEANDIQVFAGTGELDFSDGKRVKLSWFPDFETAIDKIDTDAVELVIDQPVTVSNDTTVDSNTTLVWVAKSNIITIASTKTLTIDGQIKADDRRALFTVTGTLALHPKIITSARWFTGTDIGDQINQALLAHVGDVGKVFLPPSETTENFSTTILFNSHKHIDFGFSKLNYTGSGSGIKVGNDDLSAANVYDLGDACRFATLINLDLTASGTSDDIVELLGIRDSLFRNWHLEKITGSATAARACLNLRSGNGSPGPGGCHYNKFENIRCDGGDSFLIDYGFRIVAGGSMSCNSNVIDNLVILQAAEEGLRILTGTGNTFIKPNIEKIATNDNSDGLGINCPSPVAKLTLIGPYMENLLYGIDMGATPVDDLCIVGGYKAASVANAFNNKDAGELYTLGADWA